MDSNPRISLDWQRTLGDPVWEEWVLGIETLQLVNHSAGPSMVSVTPMQHALVVVCATEPSESERDLLVKILAAINLTIDRVLLHSGPVDSWATWSGSRLMALGCQPEPIAGQALPASWVTGPSLRRMLEDPEAKKSLWGHIKNWKHLES